MSLSAGVGRLHTVYTTGDDKERLGWRKQVQAALLQEEVEVTSSTEHFDRIQRFIDRTEDDVVLQNSKLSFGVAQKTLNVFLKYAWVADWVREPPHCPVDSRILRIIGRSDLRFSKMDRTEYEEVMAQITKMAKPQSVAMWELDEFEKDRP